MKSGIQIIQRCNYKHVLGMLIISICVSANTWAGMDDGELVTAAGKGDLSRVKALLDANANVNVKADGGTTALIAASQNGYEEVVQMLLAAKADVNAKTGNCTTALMRAAQKCHEQVVQELL